jgi:hypothetical protein
MPAAAAKIDPIPHEHDALLFEERPLGSSRFAGEGDFPFTIDDTMPGDVCPGRQIVQCISDETALTGEPGEARNFAIGGHAAAWNPADRVPDARMDVTGRAGHGSSGFFPIIHKSVPR